MADPPLYPLALGDAPPLVFGVGLEMPNGPDCALDAGPDPLARAACPVLCLVLVRRRRVSLLLML